MLMLKHPLVDTAVIQSVNIHFDTLKRASDKKKKKICRGIEGKKMMQSKLGRKSGKSGHSEKIRELHKERVQEYQMMMRST